MVKKVYCDVCGKEVELFMEIPGIALYDPECGQVIAIALNDIAFDERELCTDHTNDFLKIWEAFLTSGGKD